MSTKHLTPQELAEREQVPVQTVYRWNHLGTGPAFLRVGKHVRFPLSEVEKWEASRLTEPGTAA